MEKTILDIRTSNRVRYKNENKNFSIIDLRNSKKKKKSPQEQNISTIREKRGKGAKNNKMATPRQQEDKKDTKNQH